MAQPKPAGPPIDAKYDWYQNATHAFVSFKVHTPEVSQEAKISFESNKIVIEYKDQKIELDLANEIVAEQSSSTSTTKKIELKLKKTQDNVNWLALEKGAAPKLIA